MTEDVDICGNDPPMSSDPSVEIERDATHGGSKCSSSSSSGSDSDSSSSGVFYFLALSLMHLLYCYIFRCIIQHFEHCIAIIFI